MVECKTETAGITSVCYPKIMKSKHSDLIVLFRDKGCGVVLKSVGLYVCGHNSNDWVSSEFEDFNEPVTLQNTIE